MFCTKCGAQASGQFCTSCGAPLSGAPAQTNAAAPASPQTAAPAPGPPPPVTAAKPMSPAVKIILAVVGICVFLMIAVMGTCGYFAYRVKQKVDQAQAEYGSDKFPRVRERDVCSLLSKDEVSEATGASITEATGSTGECTYASTSNPRVFQATVAWQGGAIAYKLSSAATGLSGGGQTVIKLSGIGDEAWTIGIAGKEKADLEREQKKDESGMLKGMMSIMGQAPLIFRKGDVMVTLALTEARDADAARTALAMKIASRI